VSQNIHFGSRTIQVTSYNNLVLILRILILTQRVKDVLRQLALELLSGRDYYKRVQAYLNPGLTFPISILLSLELTSKLSATNS